MLSRAFFFSFLCFIFNFFGGWAEENKLFATDFLRIPVGNRALGLGGAYTSLANEASALYWNPAGLAQLSQHQLLTEARELDNDLRLIYLSSAAFFKPLGVISGAVSYLSLGEIPVVLERPLYQEPVRQTMNPFCMTISFGWGKKFFPALSLGAAFKYFRQDFDFEESSGAGVALDLGGLYQHQLFSVGAALLHLGPPYKVLEEKIKLPTLAKLGVSYPLLKKSLTLSLDVEKVFLSREVEIHLGVEYLPLKNLSLRSGCQIAKPNSFSLGLGYKISDWQVDYALVIFGQNLAITHQAGFLYSFGGEIGRLKKLQTARRKRIQLLTSHLFPQDKSIAFITQKIGKDELPLIKAMKIFYTLVSYSFKPTKKKLLPWEVVSKRQGSKVDCLSLYISCLRYQKIPLLLLSTLKEDILLIGLGLSAQYKKAFSPNETDYFVHHNSVYLPLLADFTRTECFFSLWHRGKEIIKKAKPEKEKWKMINLNEVKNPDEKKFSSPAGWKASLPPEKIIRERVEKITHQFTQYQETQLGKLTKKYEELGDKKSINQAGIIYAQMLKYEQAEQKLKKAIALDKKYAPAYNNLGNLYALQGNFEMAELEYEIALSTNPKLGAAYFNWAFVHLLQGKENLAFQKFKEGLKKSPSLQEGLGVLGIKVEKEIKRLSEEKFKSLLEKYEFLPAEKFKKKIKKNIFLPTINSNKILAQIFYWLE